MTSMKFCGFEKVIFFFSFALLKCRHYSTKSGQNDHNSLLSTFSFWINHLKKVHTNYGVGKPKGIFFPGRTELLLLVTVFPNEVATIVL